MNNQYEENRFAYLKSNSTEQLIKLQEDTIADMEYALEQTEDNAISSQQRTEAYEDLKYGRDLLSAVQKEIQSRNTEKLR